MTAAAEPSSGSSPTHAGGVVVRRMEGDTSVYLVVRPSTGADQWVLPKGHIEPGESAEAAAVREVREETGAVATIVAELGRASFERAGREIAVIYFLMKWLEDVPPLESREIRWAPYDDAVALLTHADSRSMLELAERHDAAGRLPRA